METSRPAPILQKKKKKVSKSREGGMAGNGYGIGILTQTLIEELHIPRKQREMPQPPKCLNLRVDERENLDPGCFQLFNFIFLFRPFLEYCFNIKNPYISKN